MASEEPAFISSFAPSFTHRELSSTPSSPMSPTKTRFSKAIRMTAATDRTTKHVITVDAQERRNKAKIVRDKATEVAFLREHEKHVTNGEEDEFSNKIASFTKGLPHNSTNGLLANPEDFELFVKSIDTGRPEDQERVPLGPLSGERFESWIANNPFPAKVRGWESSGAGLTFDLEGADAQAFTMPPAPRLDSDELVTEVTELYAMALLRDDPIINFGNCFTDAGRKVERYIKALNSTPFIKDPDYYGAKDEKPRRRGPFDFQNVFRGIFKGDDVGPYLSQFIYIGTPGLGNLHLLTDGIIQYGSMSMDQRVRIATPYRDFMTTWGAYLDVQNGADVRGRESYENEAGNGYRFIATPRDLATYVHYDALYQAYLNATLIMLDMGVKFDRGIPSQDGTHRILGIPFQEPDEFDKQQGFAHFGGPHILTLVTEVATRALKAVRFQKFNTHRRLRPEAVGGLVDRYMNKKDSAVEAITSLTSRLDKGLMEEVSEHNYCQNQNCDRANDNMNGHEKSFLMPMAFPEGSPMHPSYGAGHATVAGGCVTMLKAFFDHEHEFDSAFQATADGSRLVPVSVNEKLTVEGELNKLASNISIGRNWAGVHYFTDYVESARLGEKIALSILEEQAYTYNEDFSMTIPTFDGDLVTIKKVNGEVSVDRKKRPDSHH